MALKPACPILTRCGTTIILSKRRRGSARFYHARVAQDRNYHAQFLTQLARAQGLQRNFEEAHQRSTRPKLCLRRIGR